MRQIATLLWITVLGASGAEAQFTLEQVFSAPFPTSLTASSDGARVAWVFDERGARNVWAADAPGFEGRRLTSFEGDDGRPSTAWPSAATGAASPSSAATAPTGPESCRTRPATPRGVEQALWVIDQGGEPRRITEPAASPLFTTGGDAVLFVRRGRVWKVGLDAEAKPEQLIHGRGSFGSLRLSPGGDRLAFVSSRGRTPSSGSTTSARRPSTTWIRPWTATVRPPSRPTGAKWRSCARRRCSSGSCSFRAGRVLPGVSGWPPWRTRGPAGKSSARSRAREASSPAPPPPTSSTGRMTAASSSPGSAPATGTTTPFPPLAANPKRSPRGPSRSSMRFATGRGA